MPLPDNQAVHDICAANGISDEEFSHRRDAIAELEMFHLNCPRLTGFEYFPNLTELRVSRQTLSVIEGLDTLVNLRYLWLHENEIEVIEGLEKCTQLKSLYLYSNHISVLENLDTLNKLETLWLYNNNISEITGLENLVSLKELNLASNKIEYIGNSLDALRNLESVNLSANRIGFIKEIIALARLPSLKSVCFQDALFGDNPVCALCNYSTYVMYHLKRLRTLDTCVVSEESKHIANATYLKKKMYYNMRIKTLQRICSNITRRAAEAKGDKLSSLNLALSQLCKPLKELNYLLLAGQADDDGAMLSKRNALSALANDMRERVNKVHILYQELRARLYRISEENISRLYLEFETGGNIRLEDGKATDVWYSSCVDLMNSRFALEEYKAYGIVGLNVHRVLRIHNRFLRNRFEETLSSMVDTSDPSYKRYLEYLFHGTDPKVPDEILRITEEGFRSADLYTSLDMDGAVVLSNAVSISDLDRVEAHLRTHGSSVPLPPGRILVVKVFLGKCGPAVTGTGDDSRINQFDYPDYDSVYKAKSSNSKQRTWYAFDRALVLPEYLIEFDYVMRKGSAGAASAAAHLNKVAEELSGQAASSDVSDIRALARPYAAYMDNLHDTLPDNQMISKGLQQPPVPPAKPKAFLLNHELILKRSPAAQLQNITSLNLNGNALTKIENLSKCVALETLILSFNEIPKIEGLGELRNLKVLDVSFNSIKRIEGLKGLNSLTHFYLNNNALGRMEDVNVLKKYTPNLQELDLMSNPLTETRGYRVLLLRRLLKLKQLDGESVTEAEMKAAADNSSSISDEMLRECSGPQQTSHSSLWRPNRVLAYNISGHDRASHPATSATTTASTAPSGSAWKTKAEELNMSHRRIRKVQHLEGLTNLWRAFFQDNEIGRLEGLDKNIFLTELSFEENRIAKIEGLSKLVNLKILDLGKNRIAKIEGLDTLQNLTQLSLEDNQITTLKDFPSLPNLMELYMGNNQVEEMRELLSLKSLPKLIILDMSGNPLCKEDNYRLYAIYQLKKLKVLDGLGIEPREQSAAKEEYSGKLTVEQVAECIGHQFFDHVKSLSLNQLKLKQIEVIDKKEFVNLTELNLDQNNLTSLSGFEGLPHLTVLRLNHNRLGGTAERPRYGAPPPAPSPVLEWPNSLYGLEVLQLGHNNIANMLNLQLHRLPKLKSLFLHGNVITKVEGLDNLAHLCELVLDGNKIRQFEAESLAGQLELRELHVEENSLRSLSHLGHLYSLQSLFLAQNRLSEQGELDKLSNLERLVELTIHSNPLARRHGIRVHCVAKLPTLQVIDGRPVGPEERDRAMQLARSNTDSSVPPNIILAPTPTNKVPLKLTSLNFAPMSFDGGSDAGSGASRQGSQDFDDRGGGGRGGGNYRGPSRPSPRNGRY